MELYREKGRDKYTREGRGEPEARTCSYIKAETTVVKGGKRWSSRED